MLSQPLWASLFAPKGRMLVAGDILRRENYARTLETIGREGIDSFYYGMMAESMVKTVKQAGGILTLKDFADYKVKVQPAVKSTYRNRTYYTSAAPSGGPVIISLLNTLEVSLSPFFSIWSF
jgi:gamma-glutamyltranspeptidase/glutathione hydrolase/leukotriene-C4 hydrolase